MQRSIAHLPQQQRYKHEKAWLEDWYKSHPATKPKVSRHSLVFMFIHTFSRLHKTKPVAMDQALILHLGKIVYYLKTVNYTIYDTTKTTYLHNYSTRYLEFLFSCIL